MTAHIVLILLCLATIVPFLIMLSSSMSSENDVIANGYPIVPRSVDFTAYQYIFSSSAQIIAAYGVTILVTVIGTIASLAITLSFAFALSQDKMPGVKIMMIMVVITMLFNGGLVPTYYVYTQIFHIKDTLPALIVPGLLMNAFNLILVRNYFRNSIPPALMEAARIDGCSKFGGFLKIVLPLSKPIIATIGLMTALGYWNDWGNGLYYITSTKYQSVQQVLRLMINNSALLQQMGINSGVETSKIPMNTVRMAIAVVAVLPVMIVYPFFQNYFVKGITIGAVKE